MLNATIAILADSRWRAIKNLEKSLPVLYDNFLFKYKYPVTIFHEDFDEGLMGHIKRIAPIDIRFKKVVLEIPEWVDKNKVPEHFKNNSVWTIGYRHMCRFFCREMHEHLKDYEYLMRLDDDSFIRKQVDFDPFEVMEDAVFGYVGQFKESESVIENLLPTVSKYFERKVNWDRTAYQMNFEVSKIDYWLSEPYKSYFDYIDKAGGIYYYRWGDIPIRTIALNEFGAKTKRLNIKYKHQYFVV